jgi:hypothetical protein
VRFTPLPVRAPLPVRPVVAPKLGTARPVVPVAGARPRAAPATGVKLPAPGVKAPAPGVKVRRGKLHSSAGSTSMNMRVKHLAGGCRMEALAYMQHNA